MKFGSAYNKGCSNMLLLFNKVSWLFLPLFFVIGTFSAGSQKMKCLFFISHSLSFSLSLLHFSLCFLILLFTICSCSWMHLCSEENGKISLSKGWCWCFPFAVFHFCAWEIFWIIISSDHRRVWVAKLLRVIHVPHTLSHKAL